MQSLLFKWFLGFYWVRHHSEQTAPFTSALRVRWHGNDCPSLNYTHDSRTQNVTPCMNMLTAVHVPLFSPSLFLSRQISGISQWNSSMDWGQHKRAAISLYFLLSFFLSFFFFFSSIISPSARKTVFPFFFLIFLCHGYHFRTWHHNDIHSM